ncbi:hypothetical protein GGS26DRAFT_70387 [Hypomontagnella submonticulosa]|nr:hypothetical protein GGS26DRAFT_70387 [Hypomontagnella submonticulosa]
MNWYRHSTVITEPVTVKPESTGKKLRRKLQKIGTQQRWYKPHDNNDAKRPSTAITNTNNKAIPETPDPNDGKWLEQLRKSGYLCRTQPAAQPIISKPIRHSMQVIPEFAHLTLNEAQPGRQLDKRASCATPTSTSTLSSTSSITRRYAKTPVYHIGQLESLRDQQAAARRVSSVEKIAESYRALLESSCAILNEPSSPIGIEDSYHAGTNHYVAREDTIQELPEVLPVTTSPHSDDGTLVAFEEDPIAFKRGLFTPELPPPQEIHHHEEAYHEDPIPSPSARRASPASPSLQICLDLLGRELSSAASGSSVRPSAETSALQVWVMIEAYERLRDKVLDMQLDRDQEQSLHAMLDTWIKALYAVHDKMTGSDGHASESDYGD